MYNVKDGSLKVRLEKGTRDVLLLRDPVNTSADKR